MSTIISPSLTTSYDSLDGAIQALASLDHGLNDRSALLARLILAPTS